MNKYFLVGLALASVSALPLAARPVSGPTCFNCSNFGGDWHCETGSIWGGTSCTVTADSCSVSGNCNAAGTERSASIPVSTILQIAETHPRVAASLYQVTRNGSLTDKTTVMWSAAALGFDQVVSLVDGGTAGLPATPGESVIHEVAFEERAGGGALVVSAITDYPEDPVFTEFRLELRRNDDGVFVPSSFSFR